MVDSLVKTRLCRSKFQNNRTTCLRATIYSLCSVSGPQTVYGSAHMWVKFVLELRLKTGFLRGNQGCMVQIDRFVALSRTCDSQARPTNAVKEPLGPRFRGSFDPSERTPP